MFNIPSTITLNTKLGLWQFKCKILHKTYASDSLDSCFHKKTIVTNANKKENWLLSLFYECQKATTHWKSYYIIFGTTATSSTSNIFRIFTNHSQYTDSLSFLLLHVKWGLYTSRRKKQEPWFTDFLIYCDNTLNVHCYKTVNLKKTQGFQKNGGFPVISHVAKYHLNFLHL